MIKNSIKIALRSFKANALFTGFNVVSLIASLLVIFIAITYLKFELGYDKFHKNYESTYRLAATLRSQDYSVIGFQNWNDSEAENQVNQITKLSELPGVKSATHFITTTDLEFISYEDKQLKVRDLLFTNTPNSFCEIFSWKPINGNLTDFNKPKSVILTKSVANLLFGSGRIADAINASIAIAGEKYMVAAIIDDVPGNSHFDFSIAIHADKLEYWGSHVYLQAEEGVSKGQIEAQINDATASIFPNKVDNPTFKRHFLQPVADIHLKSDILYELKPPGNSSYLVLIGCFALFILGICIFNYTNYTLALKSRQSKAIGIKKVIGASRADVARQFIFEGVLLALFAGLAALLLLPLVIPVFNQIMDIHIILDFEQDTPTLVTLLLLAVIVGLISSLAPAYRLSGLSALRLFQNRLKAVPNKTYSTRKYLVISQFVIIICISAVSYFVQNQVCFIQDKDLGFNKDNIVYAYTSPEKLDRFQQALKQIPEIDHVANGSSLAIGTFNQQTYKIEGEETIFDDSNQLYMDYAALKAYDIKSTLPESVFETSIEQPRRTIINKTAAEKFAAIKNIPLDAIIGMTIIGEPEYENEDGTMGIPFTVDGIFEDINLFSLREKIAPYFIVLSNRVRMNGMSIIALNEVSLSAGLEKIQTVYNALEEPFPLELQFLDRNYEALHAQDKQMAKLVVYLNAIAVFLALLGIIGITLILVVSRTKEIGIRKVLGASVTSILKISVREYVVLVGVATLLAWPIVIFIIQQWLANFAYRIAVNQFAILGIAAIILIGTLIVVAAVSLKAAISNPVKSLRIE